MDNCWEVQKCFTARETQNKTNYIGGLWLINVPINWQMANMAQTNISGQTSICVGPVKINNTEKLREEDHINLKIIE
jgi:hypothetical protein